ncbi:MAG: Two-component system, OmpR family, phosphate regulon sensor histidine kinase PhoR [Daejeonella sp.]|nr:Two-component system, OmpR family, phosphate regulon sensor histidine kinase PhoR [Daejeonella sp.]
MGKVYLTFDLKYIYIMKKKLTVLFFLITFSVLGIIYFQVDWMYKTYKAELKKINSNADMAMRVAIEEKYFNDHKSLISKLLIPRLARLNDSVAIGFSQNNDSLTITLQDKYNPKAYQKGIVTARMSFDIGRVKVTLPSRTFTPNKSTLKNNDDKTEKIIREVISTSCNSCKSLYLKSDSAKIAKYFKENLVIMNMGELTKHTQLVFFSSNSKPPVSFPSIYEYRSNGIEYYVNNNKRWVGAYFHNYSNRILSQMLGPIILSGVLILITIFSFAYLLRTVLKQKRLADMKDDFINNMTHELKTPIATISAAIESMQNFNVLQDKEKTNRYLETSRKELLRLNDLVTKVLNMATYEKNDIELVIKNVDVTCLVEDIISTEKLKADKTVNFTFLNPDTIKHIQADPLHFRNVLANLVNNAIKYSNNPVDITISCYKDQKFAYFLVKDNGMGVPSSQITRIFDKFHRIPTGNIHNIKGTGLGLSYVKYVVEKHGGGISVKSDLNKGSEFTVSLPLK